MNKEHSWDIVSSKVAEKVLDRSVFLHNSTGIPINIRPFFGVENLKRGDKVQIVLNYNAERFLSRIEMGRQDSPRTRMCWNSDFASVLNKTFPDHFLSYTSDTPINEKVIMRLAKISETSKEFKVTFRIEKEINEEKRFTLEDFKKISKGDLVTADDIAQLSGQNRMKGIHPIFYDDFKAVIVLCTIGGEKYSNEWLDRNKNKLKYYMEARTDNKTGKRFFKPSFKSNQAIISSRDNYPLFVFVRNKKGERYTFEGEFLYQKYEEDETGTYFVLVRNTTDVVETMYLSDFGYIEDSEDVFSEGKKVIRIHVARERDSRIKKKKIEQVKKEKGKVVCEICGFDFEKTYGERGKDFIEVHHTKPLSELKETGGLTRLEDLVPVCANCHRIIHRYKPWLTVDQMKIILHK